MTILEFFRTTRANLWFADYWHHRWCRGGLRLCIPAAEGVRRLVLGLRDRGRVRYGGCSRASTAAKERARSYAAIVSSEAVAQKIKQNTPELSLSTGQIRSSLTATAGDNAALITVSAQASSPKNAQLLANSALQATADYIKEIEQNPGNAQALVNGDSNAAATPRQTAIPSV